MGDDRSFKYCHACGFEYYAFVDVCTECDAELTPEPIPVPVAAEPGSHDMGQMDFSGLSEDDRALLALLLRALDVPIDVTDTTLYFPKSRVRDVRAQLEVVVSREVGVASIGDNAPPAATVASVARGLRVRDPSIASRWQRLAGWYVDSILIAVMVRIGVWVGVGWWAAVIAAAVYIVVSTAVFGRTLGKAAVRIQVVDERTSEPPSWPASGLRWFATGWAWFVPLLGSATLVTIAWVLVAAMYAPILWDHEGRGLHDRIAGTVVVRNRVR